MATPPCARCARLDLECTVEPRFRRSNQRERMRQLESHVLELRQSLGGTADLGVEAQAQVQSLPGETEAAQTITPESLSIADRRNEGEPHFENSPYKLGSVLLSASQAEQLRFIFFSNYHPMVPFMSENLDIVDCYRTCPLLFWTMISIAASRFDSHPTLLTELAPALDELLNSSIISGVNSPFQIQAVILLGYWPLPLPHHRFWTNRTLLYWNVTVTSAMQLGLHRPGYEREYTLKRAQPSAVLPDVAVNRNMAWVAALSLSLSATTDLGLPPLVPALDSMTSSILDEIPESLRHHFLIEKCSHRIISRLSSAQQHSDILYEELESFEHEVAALRNELGPNLSFTNALRLLYSKMYIQCMFLLPLPSQASTDESQQQQRTDGILRAYTTAASLITTAVSHEDALNDLQYAPAQIPRMILVAALVVFRVMHSSFAAALASTSSSSMGIVASQSDLTTERGRALCGMACFSIQRCSLNRVDETNNLPARMVDMLKKLWRAADSDAQFCSHEPVVRVTSRMGAGIILDTLDIWRRRYNKGDGRAHPLQINEDRGNVNAYAEGNVGERECASFATHFSRPPEGLCSDPLGTGSLGLEPGAWEGMDWDFTGLLCEGSGDWSPAGLL
ncbi:hypothetical protein BJX65DRAFT_305329 [Aspergillus insuetus]